MKPSTIWRERGKYTCGRKNIVDENKDCLLGTQLDALADNINKLANRQVSRDKVLLLVDVRNIALL